MNEFQNALVISRMTKPADDGEKIEQAVNNGKFVVVYHVTDYCRFTDAICGSSQYIGSIHDTREQATDSLLEALANEQDREVDIFILPLQPLPVESHPPVNVDDIPF